MRPRGRSACVGGDDEFVVDRIVAHRDARIGKPVQRDIRGCFLGTPQLREPYLVEAVFEKIEHVPKMDGYGPFGRDLKRYCADRDTFEPNCHALLTGRFGQLVHESDSRRRRDLLDIGLLADVGMWIPPTNFWKKRRLFRQFWRGA